MTYAQSDDWNVRNRGKRQQRVLRRFMAIVESKPTRGFAYKRMVQLARRSPGLDRLLEQYRKKAKRAPNKRNYQLIYAHLLNTTRQRAKALEVYNKIIKRSPNFRLGHLYVAQLLRTLQRYQKSFYAYQRTLALSKSKLQKSKCLKAMGALQLLMKKPQQALKYWQQFLALQPRNIRAREELALAMMRYKLYGEALKQWQEVRKRSRGAAKRSRVLRKMGQLFEQWGKWQKAVTHYRKAMSSTRRGHWLRRELNERILQLHRENGKLKLLVAHLQKKKRKGRAELAMMARLLDELGRDKKAAVAYAKALRADPSATKLRQKYITLLEVLNRVGDAIKQYKALIRRDPREPRHRLAYAEMLSRVGKRKESLAAMRTLARTFSSNTEILNRLANLYRRRRMTQEALLLYKRLIRLEPREPAHRRALGEYFHQMGEYKKALAVWRGILRSGMPTHKAYSSLGLILRDHDMQQEALKWFKKALKLKPKEYAYQMQLGELYQRILDDNGELKPKDLAQAIKVWKVLYKKAKLRNRKKRAMQQLFALYHAQGTLYRLSPKYKQRLRRNPRDIEAMRWLGEYRLWEVRRQGGKSAYSAKRYFNMILKVKANDLDALLTLEQLAARKRYWARARRLLLRAIKADPKGRRNYYRRICNYSLKMGAFRDAIKYGREALKLHPDDAAAHADLARIYRRAKKPQKAIRSYKEAIRLRPHSYSYYLALAKLERRHGSSQEAAERYRHVVKNAKDGRLIYEAAIQAIDLYLSIGQTKQFESDLQTLADAHPRELAYFRALAELYRRQGRMKEYRVAYLKAAATVDQKSQVYKQLAEVAREQGDLRKAIIYFRKMLEESPNPTPRNQIQLASFHLQVGDNGSASKILLALLNEYPTSLRVLRQVASLFYQYNMTKEATRAYELFLDQEYDSSFVRMKLAELYQRQQQFQAAAGLLSELVWGELDKPIPTRKKKKKKASKKRKKKLPYYLRRRYFRSFSRYRSRYRQLYKRRRAMRQLIRIYERLRMLDQWDRRVLLVLTDPRMLERYSMVRWLNQYYRQRRWFERLEKVLLTLHKRTPQNSTWIGYLAKLYQQQGRYADALALYTELEKINPRSKRYNMVQKIRLVLGMKDKARLDYMIQEFLSNQLGLNSYRMRLLLRLLEQHNQYKAMEKVLHWSLRNGRRSSRQRHLDKLISVYLRLGKQKQARMRLWQSWNQRTSINRYSSLASLMTVRYRLMSRLWPLLANNQKKWLLKHTEQELLETLLRNQPKKRTRANFKLKLALVDMLTLSRVSKGDSVAQLYLPALWGMTSSSFDRRKIMKNLLQQGKYKLAIALMKKGLQGTRSPTDQLYYLRLQLRTISQYELLPPRVFSRFLERRLRKLRKRVAPQLWNETALDLSDRYLKWGNYQRAIWWVGVCRWVGGPKLRKDDRFMLRLARAWRRKGNEKRSQRFYKQVVKRAWDRFKQKPESAYERYVLKGFFERFLRRYYSRRRSYRRYWQLYLKLKQAKSGWKAYLQRHRFTHYRYRYLLYSINSYKRNLNKKYPTPLQKSAISLRSLFKLHAEANRKSELFARLRESWEQTPHGNKRKSIRLYHLLAAYHIDWKKHRTPRSMRAMLALLRGLLVDRSSKKIKARPQMYSLLAALEAESGNYTRSIRLYKKLAKTIPNNKPAMLMGLLRKVARIYGQAGKQKQQWRTQVRLSNQLQDGLADRWLASYYLERGRLSEAIRYYRQYQRRGVRVRRRGRYTRSRRTYSAPLQHLGVATFLLKGGHPARAKYFLKRSLGTLRLQTKRSSIYRTTMYKAMLQLLHIGQLQPMLQTWEEQRKQSPKDLHLLSMLHTGYQILDKPKKVRTIMASMLSLRPYDTYLLRALLTSYKEANQHKDAIAFLLAQYGKRNPKPDRYYLWLGRLYAETAQKQKAYIAWQNQFEECQKQSNTYRKFYCRYYVGKDILEAGEIKRALKVFIDALKQSNYRYYSSHWYIRQAAHAFLEKGAYKEGAKLIRFAMSRIRSYKTKLNTNKVLFYGMLIRAYEHLKQDKQKQRYLKELANGTFSRSYGAQQAAAILERHGRLLAAERCYWQGFTQAMSKTSRQSAYGQLCAYWHRHGLGRLCDKEELKPTQRLEQEQRRQLAARLEASGFPLLALLEYRKLRLSQPNNPKLLKRLFALSLQVGRQHEAGLLLAQLKRSTTKDLSAFRQKLRAAQKQPVQATHGDLHTTWRPLQVPGWCKSLKADKGTLKKQQCIKQKARCKRNLLRVGKWLVTNDCRGHIIGVHAAKGTVEWVHQLPPLEQKQKISSSRSRKTVAQLYRYYDIQDLKADSQSIFIAANENWLESGYGWGSGVHVRLHLRKLDLATGKLLWKRVRKGDFVKGRIHLHNGRLSYNGRRFQVLNASDGKEQWHTGQGSQASAWLFGDKTPLPHLTLANGYLLSGQDSHLRFFSPQGELRWSVRLKWPILGLTAHKETFVALNSNGLLMVRRLQDGKLLWKKPMPTGQLQREHRWIGGFNHEYEAHPNPVVHGEKIILATADGMLRAFSLEQGRLLWSNNIGDFSALAPTIAGNTLTLAGHDGVLITLDATTGKLLWRFQMPEQAATMKQEALADTHTVAIPGKKSIWYGGYDKIGRFSLYAFVRQPKQVSSRTKSLFALARQLERERKNKLALHLLQRSVNPSSMLSQQVFLKLAVHRLLSQEQKLGWVYAYLNNSSLPLKQAIARLPKSIRKKSYSVSPVSIYNSSEERLQTNLIKLMLLLFHPRKDQQDFGLSRWKSFALSRKQAWLKPMGSPMARRLASLLLQHKKQEVRLLAAFSLSIWGVQHGRRALIKLVVQTQKRGSSDVTRLRLASIRTLLQWDGRYNWKGAAFPQDTPLLLPLLQDNQREIRLRVAIFLGRMSLYNPAHRRHFRPKVKAFLGRSTTLPDKQLAVLAAITLARLGDRKGVLYLRRLYNQLHNYPKHRVARILQNRYNDYWGRQAIFGMYQGRFSVNLSMPSFRIIYAGLLLRHGQTSEALFQFKRTFKANPKMLTPQHKAMALLGEGQCLYKLKRYKLAQKKFEQARQVDPSLAQVDEWTGAALAAQGQREAARRLLEKEWKQTAGSSSLLAHLVDVYYQMGRAEQAQQLLQKTLREQPYAARESMLYSFTKAALKHTPPAKLGTLLGHSKKLLKRRNLHPDYLFLQAKIYHKMRRFKEARQTLNQAVIQEAPNSPRRPLFIKTFRQWFKRTPKIYIPKL